MRLGIISDTHGVLPSEVCEIFLEVDHILHAGDVGDTEILVELEALAPISAVYGNTDGFDLRHRLPKVAKLELDGLYVTVTHGDQFGTPTPQRLREEFPEAEVLIYGHTHQPLLELVDGTVTIMNPGSASRPPADVAPSVGIMELEPGLPPRARLVPLGRR